MLHRVHLNRKRAAGFGLVEIMVALVIGMFGVLVMMQVLTVTEEQKRTTTAGNDAMNEGVLGLYAVQTDLRMSGYGIADRKLMGCSLTLPSGTKLNNLAHVKINSSAITGQDANTDTLLVFYGTTSGTPQGDNIVAIGNVVQTPSIFAVNDWVLPAYATPPSPCDLNLQRVAGVAGKIVTLASGSSMDAYISGTGPGTLFNLGQSYRAVGYAIRGGNLTMCDFAVSNCSQASAWVSIANNMVSLRAQYGRDVRPDASLPTPTPPAIVNAIVGVYDQTTPTTACGWSRVAAVRLALVARSTQAEKNVVTTAAPVWEGSYDATGNAAATIVLTGFADWKKYRYKVFQTTVPLRNLSWMGVMTGC